MCQSICERTGEKFFMQWTEVTVHTTTEGAELVADLFENYPGGNGGVAICDRRDVLALIREGRVWDYIDDSLWQNMPEVVLVKGFLPEDRSREGLCELREGLEALAARSVLPLGSLEITTRAIDDQDWFNVWKKHYRAIEIEGVAIVPVWENYQGDKTVVKIDPGMAFGTGEHETTSLCIRMMQRAGVSGKSVIDVGCGSGILGITAHKLGAKSVYLCDIDPVAVDSAKINARLNGCEKEIVAECRDLLKEREVRAEVILINIVADVLIAFSEDIGKHLEKGGKLVLSGIIHARLEDVKEAYAARGFRLLDHLEKGEWDCLLLQAGD